MPIKTMFSFSSLPLFYQGLAEQLRLLPVPRVTRTELQRLAALLFPDAPEFVARVIDTLRFCPHLYPDMVGEADALHEEQRRADGYAFLQRVFQGWADQCQRGSVVCQSAALQHARRLTDRIEVGKDHPDTNPSLDHTDRFLQMLPAILLLTKFWATRSERRQATLARQKTDPTYPERLAAAKRARREKQAAAQRKADSRTETRERWSGVKILHMAGITK